MNILQWIEDAHGLAKLKGWWDDERDAERSALLITTELGEAVEWRRQPQVDGLCDKCEGDPRARVAVHDCKKCRGTGRAIGDSRALEEHADALIRLFDTCGGFVVDPTPFVVIAEDEVDADLLIRPTKSESGITLRAVNAVCEFGERLRLLEQCLDEHEFDEEWAGHIVNLRVAAAIQAARAYAWIVMSSGAQESLEYAMGQKHDYNRSRPRKHGKAF